MPYPIAKLSYGLRHRIGELATLNERYNLQIAAGNAAICPPKLQPIKMSFGCFEFCCKNSGISVYSIEGKFGNRYLYLPERLTVCRSINLHGFDVQNMSSDIFGQFRFESVSLQLINCAISKPFFDAVSTIASVNHIMIDGNKSSTAVISFCDIFHAFPNLESLWYKYCFLSENWLYNILMFKNKELKRIVIFVNADQFKTFEFNDLNTLLKKERPGFDLCIFIKSDAEHVKLFCDRLKTYMNVHYPSKYDVTYIRFTIHYNDIGHYWYLPPNDAFTN